MYKFKIVKLKNFILPFILIFFTICLVVFSNSNLKAAKNGLVLWANSVVPSLFPFFVATELLSYTNFTYYLGKLLNKFMKPLFNIRGEGSFAFIMGILSGYPMGAKIAANFRQNNICSKVECERLLSFTNNSGPLFIIGSVGISLFGNSTIGFLLLFTHLLASISVGFLFRFWKKNDSKNFISSSSNIKNRTIKLSSLGEIIGNSIKSSINKMYEQIVKKEIDNIMEKIRLMLGIAPEDYFIEQLDGEIAKCTSKKEIIISPEIIQFKRETIEYVIAHEFCHLKYKTHCKSFNDIMEEKFENYIKIESELSGYKF